MTFELSKAVFGQIDTCTLAAMLRVTPSPRVMCLKYAELETKLGEIDRARGIYSHGSQMSDPRTSKLYWKAWQEFEVRHGNEDTFREMLRIKRSVQAQYNTQVSLSHSLSLSPLLLSPLSLSLPSLSLSHIIPPPSSSFSSRSTSCLLRCWQLPPKTFCQQVPADIPLL